MYKINIVSRCQKNALKKTRAIVDLYAKRISDKTWQCNITNEGLQNLVSHLRKEARRNTSVSIYIFKEGVMKLFVIIGNKNKFGIDGSCPVSTSDISSHDKYFKSSGNKNISEYKQLLNLIGYSHDLGKMSNYFQKFLSNPKKPNKDLLRHELLSVLFYLINEEVKQGTDTKDFISKELAKIKSSETKKFSEISFPENSILIATVLTHHKILGYSGNIINLKEHIRDFDDIKDKFDVDFCMKHLNHSDTKYILQRFFSLKKDLEDKNIFFKLNRGHFIYFRLALMLSDHFVSSRVNKNKKRHNKELLAKSISYGGESLKAHLSRVGKVSSIIIEDFTKIRNKLSHIYKNEINEKIFIPSRGKFLWQNKALKQLKQSSINKKPNLVFLASSTGSGKTITGIKIAAMLSGDSGIRLSVALGLRTLTTQTAKVYEDFINRDNIATLIGSTDALELNKKLEEECIENDKVDSYENIDLDGGLRSSNLPKYIKTQAYNRKRETLIDTPVLISTIDYLIKATDWRKSNHILAQLRLMSSDLIIDEIDMYGTEDFKSVTRMIYLCGLFGKNLIITTATLSKEVATAISDAYYEGNRDFSLYEGVNRDFNVHLLSDFINESYSTENIEKLEVKDKLKGSIEKLSKDIEKNDWNNKAVIFDNTSLSDYVENSIELHHKNKYSYKDIQTSIGLVKANSIKDAYKIANEFNNQAEDLDKQNIRLNLMFYHGRLLLGTRIFLEKKLDEALYRKGKIDPFLDSSIIKEAYNKKDENTTDIVNIVISTGVEEVGRDHDFDWCIVESTSTRSIIQICGRVRRHREEKAINTNVIVMKNTFKQLSEKQDSKMFNIVDYKLNSSYIMSPQKDTLPFIENNQIESEMNSYFNNKLFAKSKHTSFISNRFFTEWRAGSFQFQMILARDDTLKIIDKENVLVEIDDSRYTYIEVKEKFNYMNDSNIEDILDKLLNVLEFSEDDFEQRFRSIAIPDYIFKSPNTLLSKVYGIV
ncbi:CRISPR-associated endonuclease Cas3'' [Poseidonibacter antarcticus]|uniref:CRISPR-associated endonuclease Cas3'' n=1 Tax=Poseidonibacter antarcticus TaxID=2478538 RepID=UPI000EF537BD|nr:CRISPR-associated endonuclease Cas3'' [Poseidonibacter antarcticus]